MAQDTVSSSSSINDVSTTFINKNKKNVLVIGATGNTGKHVVRQLLDISNSNDDDEEYTVQALVRSKQRFIDILPPSSTNTNNDDNKDKQLQIIEGSILELPDTELDKYVQAADTVVLCLGHVMSFQGIFGHPRRLVTDSVKRITDSIKRVETSNTDKDNKKSRQLILMNSEGVVGPGDTKLSFLERCLFGLIRFLLPPHVDNEQAAEFLYKTIGPASALIEWIIVRPCNLLDGNSTEYVSLPNPPGTTILFEHRTVTRATVAKFMVDLVTQSALWNQWKYQFPYVQGKGSPDVTKDNAKEL
jgi:nucleoside-diphosphate-sugar epimerase